jgi:hypothetical protein
MMSLVSAWATVVLALGVASIGATAGLLGGWLQHRYTIRREQSAARAARLREGATVIAPVALLLTDADPARLGVNINLADPLGPITELRAKWDELRTPLAAYAVSNPSTVVRDAGQKLIVAVSNALTSASWMLHDHARGASTTEKMLETAKSDHAEARALVECVLASIRDE